VELVSDLAAERPVVALVEDLHWADDELLDLIERVQREVPGPLLVIATARPELLDRRPEWGGGRRNSSLLWLEALGPADARSMLDALVTSSLPDRLRSLVAERAEGNPFFVEELVAALVDRGVILHTGDGWAAQEHVDDVAVPDSVHAVLAARIDLLPREAKEAPRGLMWVRSS
jgi:predicted ATPase